MTPRVTTGTLASLVVGALALSLGPAAVNAQEDTRIVGELLTVAVDAPDPADHRTAYLVQTPDGKLIEVDSPSDVRELPSATRTRAKANSRHRLYVAKVSGRGAYADSDGEIARRIDTILDRWVEESSGAIRSFVRVEGFKSVAVASCNDVGGMWTAGRAAFPDVDFGGDSGNHLLVMPPDNGCVFGVGTIGDDIDSGGQMAIAYDPVFWNDVLMHELGHNLSLDHARARSCDEAAACGDDEYGNRYSFMGASTTAPVPSSLDSMSRLELGIDARCEVPTMRLDGVRNASSTFDLVARGRTTGTRGVRAIAPVSGAAYTIDWRNGAGRDAAAPYGNSPYHLGVTVQRVDDDGVAGSLRSHAVDGGRPYALREGQSFSSGGLTVRVLNLGGRGARKTTQVKITLTTPSGTPGGALRQKGGVAITGKARPGGTLKATPTSWTKGACFRYQWLRGGKVIPGARHQTLPLARKDVGDKIAVRLTGQRSGYEPRQVTSRPVTVRR